MKWLSEESTDKFNSDINVNYHYNLFKHIQQETFVKNPSQIAKKWIC